MTQLSVRDVEAAANRFDNPDIVHHTPLERSRSLSDRVGGDVRLKMEHLQRTGSFKTRGAYAKLLALADRDDVDAVVAASAGNHAQGVALAATKVGIPATVVMPKTAPQAKIDATRGYGATVILEDGPSVDTVVVDRFDPAVDAWDGTRPDYRLDRLPTVTHSRLSADS